MNIDVNQLHGEIKRDKNGIYTIINGNSSITLTEEQLNKIICCSWQYQSLCKSNKRLFEANKRLAGNMDRFTNIAHGHDCCKDEENE